METPLRSARSAVPHVIRLAAKLFGLATAIALIALTAGCDEKLSDIAGPTPNLEPTFASISENILLSTGQGGCITCHTNAGRQPAGGLSMAGDTYAALVGVNARGKAGAVYVIPGDPENSYLIHKLEGRSSIAGVRMPRVGAFLTDGQILIIRRWIQQGATRN